MPQNQTLEEKIIIQTLWLERFQGETPGIIRQRLERASRRINAVINRTNNIREIRRVINEQLQIVYADYPELIFQDMENIAEMSYNAANTIYNNIAAANSFPEAPTFVNLSQAAQRRIVNSNRPLLGQTLQDLKANAIFSGNTSLRQAISEGLEADLSLPVIQRRARAIEFKDEAIGKMSRHNLNTVVNTALKGAIEEARGEVYNQHDDIIIGWRSLGTLDNRTSNICRTLDNEFYPKPQFTWETVPYKPPRHPNCRSIILGETRFDQEDISPRSVTFANRRTVNHRDGTTSTAFTTESTRQVSGRLSFNQVFESQGVAFKRDYLGTERYNLYRRHGSRVLREMYNLQRNELLTLDELRARLS